MSLSRIAVSLTVAVATQAAAAESSFAPTGAFLQLGAAEGTHAATVGLAWRWKRQWVLGSGVVSGYWAAAISGWRYAAADGVGYSNLGQLSFTPVVRYTPAGGSAAWFIEGGIGATYSNKVYVTEGRTFSTRFNFGDQIAIGTFFGAAREYEVTLRFEHFSNADLEFPNPGQNFIQLRLAMPLP
ncbi:MAG: acyloxyacyl hydrolase [Burkholderiales bacterium]